MKSINFKGILKAVIFSCLITFLTLVLITALSYFTDINMKTVDLIVLAGLGLSIILGAFLVSRSAEQRAAFHGIFVGVGVFLIFLLCSLIVNGGIVFNSHLLSVLIISLVAGLLGGIMGR